MNNSAFATAENRLNSLIKSGIKLGLDNSYRLLAALGNPQNELDIIHIAGTNGKGSTSACLSAAFHNCNIKTGFFCSPHLVSIHERFRINGKAISDDDFAYYVNYIFDTAPELLEGEDTATYFEFVCAMSLLYFKDQGCELVILEVGMGGRLDASNVVKPILSVITNIGYDHMDALGNTLTEIAGEKAGIIKPAVPVLCGYMPQEASLKIKEVADKNMSKLISYGIDFEGLSFEISDNSIAQKNIIRWQEEILEIKSLLIGPHQLKNVSLAWAIINTYKLN